MHAILTRKPLGWLVIGLLMSVCSTNTMAGPLVSKMVAHRVGLDRGWFTQVQMNAAYTQVSDWSLAHDELFVLTNVGLVHAIDANTGHTLWIARMGNPDYPSLGPAVNSHFVAIINGTTLFVLHRDSGRLAMEQRLGGAPGAKPVLTEHFVYTPLINGRMVGYPLDDSVKYPQSYYSSGRTTAAPLATPNGLVWSTSEGHLYSLGSEQSRVRYRLESRSPFAASATYRDETLYAMSAMGDLYAVDEAQGEKRWRYSTGYPARQSPAVIRQSAFVVSDQPALHCVNIVTGEARWTAPGIRQFAAASKDYVYGMDRYGGLAILHAASGARMGELRLAGNQTALANDLSDRIFLLSDRGLLQCLHEVGATEPTYFVEGTQEADEPAAGEPAGDMPILDDSSPHDKADAAPDDIPHLPTETSSPFGDDPDADPADNPFGGFGEEADDNPFGDFGEE